MVGSYKGTDIRMMVDGKEIGRAQSIDATKIHSNVEPAKIPNGVVVMGAATVNVDLLRKALGIPPEPQKFDITVNEYKQVGKLPHGRTRLPKKKRLNKKWLKRYYYVVKTVKYLGCHVVDAEDSWLPKGGFSISAS